MKVNAARVATLTAVTLLAHVGWSQTTGVTMRFLNGKNGKPLRSFRVYVIFDNKAYDAPGQINQLSSNEGIVNFDPIGHTEMKVRVVGTVNCGGHEPAGFAYKLSEVVSKGFVSTNDCGHHQVDPHPGEFVYYLKPASWWQLLKN